jgi:hypothetical protein
VNELSELKQLWLKLLGDVPAADQWELWAAMHTIAVIKKGILQCAAKNMALGKIMDQNFKLRFASSVMNIQSDRNAEHAENRERLKSEFGGAQ